MGLPNIQHATFEVTQPSTGKPVLLRRFLISEEKMFLLAKQSADAREISRACIQVVDNCIVEGPRAVDLTTFDLDWFFLKLRSQSVDNIISVQYEDPEDGEVYKFTVNLEDVQCPLPASAPPVIEIDDKIKMKLRFPTVADMEAVYEAVRQQQIAYEESLETDNPISPPDMVSMFVAKCVASIYDDEEVYTPVDEEELIGFLNQLQPKTYKGIQQFVDVMPELAYVIKYQDVNKVEREIALRGIESFFTF